MTLCIVMRAVGKEEIMMMGYMLPVTRVVVNIGIRNNVQALQACILASGVH